MLVLSRSEVEELLDLDALLDALAAAHAELSAGTASLVPRVGAFAADGILGAMLGYAPSAGLGCKLVTLFPENRDRPTHQALISLFDPATGTPVALMDGTYITAMRTAAAAALATRLLARPDARVLAILGTGVQSRSAQEMFPHARDFAEVRVAGRGEFEDAVRGADVVHAPLPAGAPELEPRGRDGVVELGEIIGGTAAGRSSEDQITLYKSVGVAVQDLAAAALVLAAARQRGAGQEIELEEIHA